MRLDHDLCLGGSDAIAAASLASLLERVAPRWFITRDVRDDRGILGRSLVFVSSSASSRADRASRHADERKQGLEAVACGACAHATPFSQPSDSSATSFKSSLIVIFGTRPSSTASARGQW